MNTTLDTKRDTKRDTTPEINRGTLLRRGCEALGLALSSQQQALLLDYLDLLKKWNKTYNLTAVRDAEEMVTRHLLDSLAIAPFVTGQRGIDVGTGAGLPGIPLAIVFPQREFHLLDSNGKKTRFLFQVKTALCLDNMVVHQARVESFHSAGLFDTVFSRAFASLQEMLHSCRHLMAPQGQLLAMKGAYPEQELADLEGAGATGGGSSGAAKEAAGGVATAVYPLAVPGLEEQRHLVRITSANSLGHSQP